MESDSTQSNRSCESKADREDVRAEYAALSHYSALIVTFRFTVAGFFLAAVGLVSAGGVAHDEALLLVALAVSLWIIELRNRALLGNLGGRGVQIEREIWGYVGTHAYDPFTCRQLKVPPTDGSSAPPPPGPDGTRIFFWKTPLAVSHTLGFDLMYLAVVIFAIYKVFA